YRQVVPLGTGASVTTPVLPVAASSTPSPANPTSTSLQSQGSPSSAAITVLTTNGQPEESSFSSASSTVQAGPQSINQELTSTQLGSASLGDRPTMTTTPSFLSTDASEVTVIPSKSVSSRTQQFVTTVVTVSSGSTHTNIFTTSGLVPVSTSTATSTRKPSLDAGEDTSSRSGLDSSQKHIIIGVVVGVGGAILLGGIAIVAWRIWGRGHSNDDDDDLMGSHPGSSGQEKRSSISGHSPFRSTLDQYHNQSKPPNSASNF
ncbi:MAG: hypothetical protein Q9219_007697, partial [cf. Caloplaca sp. 3 TL-2023]